MAHVGAGGVPDDRQVALLREQLLQAGEAADRDRPVDGRRVSLRVAGDDRRGAGSARWSFAPNGKPSLPGAKTSVWLSTSFHVPGGAGKARPRIADGARERERDRRDRRDLRARRRAHLDSRLRRRREPAHALRCARPLPRPRGGCDEERSGRLLLAERDDALAAGGNGARANCDAVDRSGCSRAAARRRSASATGCGTFATGVVTVRCSRRVCPASQPTQRDRRTVSATRIFSPAGTSVAGVSRPLRRTSGIALPSGPAAVIDETLPASGWSSIRARASGIGRERRTGPPVSRGREPRPPGRAPTRAPLRPPAREAW